MDMIASYRMVDMEVIDHLLQSDEEDLTEEIQEIFNNKSIETLDIEKRWDGLHFLLTGKSVVIPLKDNHLSEAVIGVHLFSENDKNDFITFLLPDEINKIVPVMEEIKKRDLFKSFSPELFSRNKIYPDIWQNRKKEELFEYIFETGFSPLLKFYKKALRQKKCVIITII